MWVPTMMTVVGIYPNEHQRIRLQRRSQAASGREPTTF